MKTNIHPIDRTIRILFAVIIALLYFTNTIDGTFAIVLVIAAVILAATAIINFCPLYYSERIARPMPG